MSNPSEFSPDQLAAHDLLSELRTRIATQPLPYQYGVESAALRSLWEIFGLARKAMKDHPGCSEFARITTRMLNVQLRPVTAKWHRAYESGVLNSQDGANDFRVDLAVVRRQLVEFSEFLQKMAYGAAVSDETVPDVLDKSEVAECMMPLKYGVDHSEPANGALAASEAKDIQARRSLLGVQTEAGVDAVGLALSGGGIRSATFCLGVVQVLSERGLMKDVDYLSTVSGGGYTGSFISSAIGSGTKFETLSAPFGPDTPPVRHVRQNAKYLSIIAWKQRWLMVAGTIAGLILNWSAPLAILSLLAIVTSALPVSSDSWLTATSGVLLLLLLAIIAHGVAIRWFEGVWSQITVAGCLALAIFCCAMALAEWGYTEFRLVQNVWLMILVAFTPIAARFLPIFQNERYRKTVFKLTLYAAGLVVPVLAVFVFYGLRDLAERPIIFDAAWWNPLHYAEGKFVLYAVFCVSALIALVLLNVNLTGPHTLYRDQLARTFIWPLDAPDVPLQELNINGCAPYHLINATVNLPSSVSPVLRDRKADFFLFSKHWCGSTTTAYSPTSQWESNGRPIDLATAMAVSGAAASPHMGLSSMPTLSALMSFLNIRLGFWVSNPTRPKPYGPPGFSCIMREMTGAFMSERNKWLNLSDGGHIDNMGLYELLRRRCKFIVCVDGEADPESTFHGQLTLVRHAQIDFGIRIEPRFDALRPDPKSRLSRSHLQLFRIRYPGRMGDGKPCLGLLLYLKLSLTGDEAELLKKYRSLNPDFPHQSTIDQFYDEEQFEAYRQLGVHVAEGAFSSAILTGDERPSTVRGWFEQLVSSMLEPMHR